MPELVQTERRTPKPAEASLLERTDRRHVGTVVIPLLVPQSYRYQRSFQCRVTLNLKAANYTRVARTWVKKDGQRTPVDKQQRVLPWWRRLNTNGSHSYRITVKDRTAFGELVDTPKTLQSGATTGAGPVKMRAP